MAVEIRPANADTWGDVVTVLGRNGGSAGCWCMFWRLTNQLIHATTGEDNRVSLETMVKNSEPVGLVAYAEDGTPVGWCQVAPRLGFPRLFHTRGLNVGDPEDASVWSIVCVFVAKGFRGMGVSDALIAAAVGYAGENGAERVEGYPVAQETGRSSQLSSGTVGLFTRAGFQLAGPVAGRRTVMRRTLE